MPPNSWVTRQADQNIESGAWPLFRGRCSCQPKAHKVLAHAHLGKIKPPNSTMPKLKHGSSSNQTMLTLLQSCSCGSANATGKALGPAQGAQHKKCHSKHAFKMTVATTPQKYISQTKSTHRGHTARIKQTERTIWGNQDDKLHEATPVGVNYNTSNTKTIVIR